MGERERLNALSNQVIGAAVAVHRALGPGLLESAYRNCLSLELTALGLNIRTEVPVTLRYRNSAAGCAYRLDILVEGAVIVEVKAVERLAPIHTAQMISYLRITHCKLGLLLNFNVRVLREGIRRIVFDFPERDALSDSSHFPAS